jgi:hypothetical protein
MTQYKVVVTVPEAEADKLRLAIGGAGGGTVGKYTFCSFSSKGIGRSLPGDGAQPAIGQIGKLEEIPEERIEISCNSENLRAVILAIRNAHSYEEPAIDIYKLEDIEL